MGCLDGTIRKVPQVGSCCCGCKLSTGAKIIAWWDIITGVIVEIIVIAGLVTLNHSKDNKTSGTKDNSSNDDTTAVIFSASVLIAIYFVKILVAFTLLLGVYKEERGKIKCWLSLNAIFFVIYLILVAISFFLLVFQSAGAAFSGLLSNLISLGIWLYEIMVVKSYYAESGYMM